MPFLSPSFTLRILTAGPASPHGDTHRDQFSLMTLRKKRSSREIPIGSGELGGKCQLGGMYRTLPRIRKSCMRSARKKTS